MMHARRIAKLEQTYLGATMIGKYHPEVTRVSQAVLWQFYSLDPSPRDPAKAPARLIRKWVTFLSDIQSGYVEFPRNTERWCDDGGIARPEKALHRPVDLVFAKAEQGAARQILLRSIRRDSAFHGPP
jgi:hypothetical protein